MILRTATEQDAPRIAAIVHAMPDLRSVAAAAPETTAEKISRNLRRAASDATSTAYVAETAAGDLAGYCAIHWVPFLFLEGGEAYVTELFVHPTHSGQGVGTRLLDEVIAEARKRGCARVSLLNGRDGESYRRGFYAKRGWTERDRMANFVLRLAPRPETTPPL